MRACSLDGSELSPASCHVMSVELVILTQDGAGLQVVSADASEAPHRDRVLLEVATNWFDQALL